MRAIAIGPDRLEDFVALPFRLHGHDPLWVPPLSLPLLAELTGQSAGSRHVRLQPFLVESSGEVVARAVALVTDRLRDTSGGVVGQIAHFESTDDAKVANALFLACTEWLRERGSREIWGPIDGGAHRAHRLMTRGFDRDPFLLEPRNPPYYVSLFEGAGFRPFHTWRSYELSREEAQPLADFCRRGAARALANSGYAGLPFDPRPDPGALLARVHPLLDAVWAGHVGYTALDLDELAETFGGLMALMDEGCVGVTRHEDSRDVGVGFLFPDWVSEVRKLKGDHTGWGRWLAGPRPSRLVLHTVAVLPDHRLRGAPFPILDHGLRYFFERGHDELLIALVTEEVRVFESVASPTREYSLYRRGV